MKQILLVDDEVHIGQQIMHFLNQRGYSVVYVQDGAEAIRLLDTAWDEYALVCCDLMMPSIGGLEVLQHLRQNLAMRCLPVVILSYPVAGDNLEEMRTNNGFAGYVNADLNIAIVTKQDFSLKERPLLLHDIWLAIQSLLELNL